MLLCPSPTPPQNLLPVKCPPLSNSTPPPVMLKSWSNSDRFTDSTEEAPTDPDERVQWPFKTWGGTQCFFQQIDLCLRHTSSLLSRSYSMHHLYRIVSATDALQGVVVLFCDGCGPSVIRMFRTVDRAHSADHTLCMFTWRSAHRSSPDLIYHQLLHYDKSKKCVGVEAAQSLPRDKLYFLSFFFFFPFFKHPCCPLLLLLLLGALLSTLITFRTSTKILSYCISYVSL